MLPSPLVDSRPRSASRVIELDRVKGLAILAVVCIHAEAFTGTPLDVYVVQRAVPVFLVLFGAASELWWQSRGTGAGGLARWYKGRFARLLPPASAAAAVWWIVAWLTHAVPFAGTGGQFAAALLGYCPRLGTNWFVVVILELVLLFPLLREAVNRSPSFALAAAGVASSVSVWHLWDVIGAGTRLLGDDVAIGTFYYQWIFAPRVFWQVVAGLVLVRFIDRLGLATTLASIALVAAGPLVLAVIHRAADDAFVGPLRQEVVLQFLDVPLTIALLGLCRSRASSGPGIPGRVLATLGKMSWGIYLGHALVFELVHVLGYEPEAGPRAQRTAYAVVLMASGVFLTQAGRSLGNAWRHLVRTTGPSKERGEVTESSGFG